MPMVLKPLDGGRPIPLDKAILFFGRGPDCDVVLNTSRKVSRKHCCVAQIDDYYLVRDLGSMNGIRVNDDVVKTEARLNAGDVLWVGDLGFRFQSLIIEKGTPAPETVSRPAKKPAVPKIADPRFLSQEIPIAIPDEGVDFAVENTGAIRKEAVNDPLMDISDDSADDED